MATLTLDDLLARNKKYSGTHTPIMTFPEMSENNIDPPRIAIVSCVDPRVVPETIFQLGAAEAVVMRHIAGHPHNAVNDIVALDGFLTLSEIAIVHHTDCGATYWTNETIRTKVKSRLPGNRDIDSMEFGAIAQGQEESIRSDLQFLKSSQLVRKELADTARGFLFDIKTGELREVKP